MSAKLPVIGSTASSTAFCTERIDGLGGTHLFVDGNGKVTAGNGTLEAPKPNALSLPAAAVSGRGHCPGSTETCRSSCYVGPLAGAQRELYDHYEHNALTLAEILDDEQLSDDWCMRLAHWISQNASEGFRWHVSGDVTSLKHAQWIADVCRESPNVRHWIYTRSFGFLAPLAEVSTLRGGNLALNLSCDADNWRDAVCAAHKCGHADQRLRLCYLTTDGTYPLLSETDVLFPDYQLRPRQYASLAESPWWQGIDARDRAIVCPVDAHNKSEKNRCGLDCCSRCLT